MDDPFKKQVRIDTKNNTYHSPLPEEENVLETIEEVKRLKNESNSECEQLKADCDEATQSYENEDKLSKHLTSINKSISNSIRYGNQLLQDFITSFKEIDELNMKSAEIVPEIEESNKNMKLLHNIIKNINQDIKQKKTHLKILMDNVLSSKKKNLDKLEENYHMQESEYSSKINDLDEDINLTTSQINNLKDENADVRTSISKLDEDIAIMSRQKEEMEKRNDAMKISIELKKQEELSLKNELAKIESDENSTIADLEQSLKRINDELAKEEKTVSEMTKELNEITGNLEITNIKNVELSQQCDNEKSEIADLEAKIKHQEEIFYNDSKVQKEHIDETEKKLKESISNIEKTMEYTKNIQKLINEAELEEKEYENKLKQLDIDIKNIPLVANLQLDEIEEQNKKISEELMNNKIKLESLPIKIKSVQDDIVLINESAKSKEIAEQASITMLQEQLDKATTLINGRKLKYDMLQKEIKQDQEQLESEANDIKSKIKNTEQINDDLEEEIQQIKNSLLTLDNESDFFTKVNEDLLNREQTEKPSNPKPKYTKTFNDLLKEMRPKK